MEGQKISDWLPPGATYRTQEDEGRLRARNQDAVRLNSQAGPDRRGLPGVRERGTKPSPGDAKVSLAPLPKCLGPSPARSSSRRSPLRRRLRPASPPGHCTPAQSLGL